MWRCLGRSIEQITVNRIIAAACTALVVAGTIMLYAGHPVASTVVWASAFMVLLVNRGFGDLE